MTASEEKFTRQRLLEVQTLTPNLFTLRTSRDPGFRFTAGQFARLGVRKPSGCIVWRAYSMVSAPHSSSTLPSSLAASVRSLVSRASSSLRWACRRMSASTALVLDRAINILSLAVGPLRQGTIFAGYGCRKMKSAACTPLPSKWVGEGLSHKIPSLMGRT